MTSEFSVSPQTRSGDPFYAAGAKLIASIFSGEQCSECGQDIDLLSGHGTPDGDRWLCDECAKLPKERRSR